MHRVLVAEDNKINQVVAAGTLKKLGYAVEIVDGGVEAVTACLDRVFAAVLMDVMMPEMDGYETTQAIRRLPEFEKLPIIALTAKAMKGDRERSIATGSVGSPVSESCSICSYSTRSTRSAITVPSAAPRATADQTRAEISDAVPGK